MQPQDVGRNNEQAATNTSQTTQVSAALQPLGSDGDKSELEKLEKRIEESEEVVMEKCGMK